MSFDTWFNTQYDQRSSSTVGYAHDGPLVLGFDQHGAGRCGYPSYRDFSDGYSAMPLHPDDRAYGWAARGTGRGLAPRWPTRNCSVCAYSSHDQAIRMTTA